MGAIRDLRELISLSRMIKIDEQDHQDHDNNSIHLKTTTTTTTTTNSSSKRILTNKNSTTTPITSNSIPTTATKKSEFKSEPNNRTSIEKSKSILLNRNSVPRLSLTNSSLKKSVSYNANQIEINDYKVESEEDNDFYTADATQLITKSLIANATSSSKQQQDQENDDFIQVEGNFDYVLTYIDASVVSEWLNRANKELKSLSNWLESSKCESFIKFANFWLVSLSQKQRRNIIDMEYSIIVEELIHAFSVSIESEQIEYKDVHRLLKSIFKEYPIQLLSFRGLYLFLDYLDVLCSDRANEYKKLLSDVKCRTSNKQYAQWLLSIRSFTLINIWSAIVNFYEKTMSEESVAQVLRAKSAPATKQQKQSSQRSQTPTDSRISTTPVLPLSVELKYKYYKEAVFKHDYPEVLHYLITTNKCDPMYKDEHNRTLVFLAVMHDQPKILNYLIKRWPKIDINEACDTGNTPLHAAVNSGKQNLVDILLKSNKLNVNLPNKQCMGMSPLHLAVWHDHEQIALTLIRNKADPYLKLDDNTNAFDLAKQNNNLALAELLEEFLNENCFMLQNGDKS